MNEKVDRLERRVARLERRNRLLTRAILLLLLLIGISLIVNELRFQRHVREHPGKSAPEQPKKTD